MPGADRDLFAEGGEYERFMGRWSRRLAPLFVRFVSVSGADAVLDVGCGTGALARACAAAHPSALVTGVDRSDAYLHLARTQAAERRLRFVHGDAQALEFPDAAFDATVSLLALNFLPDRVKALDEMVRVTRPGGVVAAAVWDYGGAMDMLRVFWDAALALDPANGTRDERHMPLSRRGELAALWAARGLDRVDEHALVIDLDFASFDDYWGPFLGGQGPAGAYAVSLDDDRRADLAAALRRTLLGTEADGPFTLGARAWAVKGYVPSARSA